MWQDELSRHTAKAITAESYQDCAVIFSAVIPSARKSTCSTVLLKIRTAPFPSSHQQLIAEGDQQAENCTTTAAAVVAPKNATPYNGLTIESSKFRKKLFIPRTSFRVRCKATYLVSHLCLAERLLGCCRLGQSFVGCLQSFIVLPIGGNFGLDLRDSPPQLLALFTQRGALSNCR